MNFVASSVIDECVTSFISVKDIILENSYLRLGVSLQTLIRFFCFTGSRITKPGNASELRPPMLSSELQSQTHCTEIQPRVLLQKLDIPNNFLQGDAIPGLPSTLNNEIFNPSVSNCTITHASEGESSAEILNNDTDSPSTSKITHFQASPFPIRTQTVNSLHSSSIVYGNSGKYKASLSNTNNMQISFTSDSEDAILPTKINAIVDSVLSKDLSVYDFSEPEDIDMNQLIPEEKCTNIAESDDKYQSSSLPPQETLLNADVEIQLKSRGITIQQLPPVTDNAYNSEDCRVSSKLSSSSNHKSSKDSSVKTPVHRKSLKMSASCAKFDKQKKHSTGIHKTSMSPNCYFDPTIKKSTGNSPLNTPIHPKLLKKSTPCLKSYEQNVHESKESNKSPESFSSDPNNSSKTSPVKRTERTRETIVSCSMSDNKTQDFQKPSESSSPPTDSSVPNSNKHSLVETVVHFDLLKTKTVIENMPDDDDDLPQLFDLPNIQMGNHIRTLKPSENSDETSAATDISDNFYKDEQEKLYGEHLSSIQQGSCYFTSTFSRSMSDMLNRDPMLEKSEDCKEARSADLLTTQKVESNVKKSNLKQNESSDFCQQKLRNSPVDLLSKQLQTSTQTSNLPMLVKRECADVRDLKSFATYTWNILKEETRIYEMKRQNIFMDFHKFFIETISKKSFSFGELDFVREMVNCNQSDASIADTRFSAAFLAFCNADTDGAVSANPYSILNEQVSNLKHEQLEKFSSRSANSKVSLGTYDPTFTNMHGLKKLGTFEQGASSSLNNKHQDETKFKEETKRKEKQFISERSDSLSRQYTPLTHQQPATPLPYFDNSELTIHLLPTGSNESAVTDSKTSGGSKLLKRKASINRKDQPLEKAKCIKKSAKTKESVLMEKFRFKSKKNALNRISR